MQLFLTCTCKIFPITGRGTGLYENLHLPKLHFQSKKETQREENEALVRQPNHSNGPNMRWLYWDWTPMLGENHEANSPAKLTIQPSKLGWKTYTQTPLLHIISWDGWHFIMGGMINPHAITLYARMAVHAIFFQQNYIFDNHRSQQKLFAKFSKLLLRYAIAVIYWSISLWWNRPSKQQGSITLSD